MTIRLPLLAIAALIASPGTAIAKSNVAPHAYTVRYDAERDVYCIRFFSDALAADPHPGRPPIICQSRARWEDDKVFIHHIRRTPSGQDAAAGAAPLPLSR